MVCILLQGSAKSQDLDPQVFLLYRLPFAPFVIEAPVLNNSVFIFIPIQQRHFLLNRFKAPSIESTPQPPPPSLHFRSACGSGRSISLVQEANEGAAVSFLITEIAVFTCIAYF